MSNYDNTNKGAMWGNKDKQSDNHPDFKGTINIEGTDYWLAGWKRKDTDSPNAPAMRFSFTPKDAPVAQPKQQAVDVGEDIPW